MSSGTLNPTHSLVDCTTTMSLQAFRQMKLCCRLLMVFLSTFMWKMSTMGIWTPFLGSYGWRTTRPWLVARWKAHGRLGIRLNFTFSVTAPTLWGEMCTARVFLQGSTSLHSNFSLPGQGRPPSNILGIRKLEDTGLLDGEDRIHLRSLVLTQYRSVTDRRTDGRTDLP